MKARDAVDLAQNLLQVRAYEARRLDLLNAALSPTVPYSGGELWIPTQQSVCSVPVETDAKPALKRMAARSETCRSEGKIASLTIPRTDLRFRRCRRR